MVLHDGKDANYGHYFSVVHFETTTGAGQWLFCNDATVRELSEASAMLHAKHAHMLFYEHVGDARGLLV